MALLVAFFAAGAWTGRLRATQLPHFARIAPLVAPETIRATTFDGRGANLDLGTRRRPLLALVLSTSCSFCRANMGAWAKLVARVADSEQTVDIVVLSTSNAADTAELLAEHEVGVPARLIEDLGAALPGVPGVPATLLIQPGTRRVEGIVAVLNRDALRSLDAWINEH